MRTMSAISKDAAQTSTYTRQLRENVKTILDNYAEVLKASKVNTAEQKVSAVNVGHVENEIELRAANIVRAAEALSKLVSEIKECLILNDFSSINDITYGYTVQLQEKT